ncbi:MAG TPA: cupin domain-containing protein [Rhodanobacteraceae bacterium]|nr:cupin domain-containing protein [Rhodanobacteraceae bacterium]
METRFPSADEYSAQKARHPPLNVVDIRACEQAVTESYRNEVLSNVNGDCLRLAVFEGEYRWHCHPDSDELFLVVAGRLQIELAGRDTLELTEWQSVVVPAGTVHRTRAIGRTVNLTCERQGAGTVFIEGPAST